MPQASVKNVAGAANDQCRPRHPVALARANRVLTSPNRNPNSSQRRGRSKPVASSFELS
jgi:hypothetical protein